MLIVLQKNQKKNGIKNENLDKTKYFLETMKNFYEKTSNFYLDLFSLDNILMSELNDKNEICINMGEPNFNWDKIPLLREMNNKNLNLKINDINKKEITGGFSLSVGNPHVVFFV